MKFSELWRLSGSIYKEVSFQSIFSLRAGSSLPQRGRMSIEQIVNNAKRSTLMSKLITTLFIAIFGFVVFLPLTISVSPVRSELTVIGSVSAYLAVVLFLIVFMGLQVSTSLVSSKIGNILGPLPLSKRDISNIVFLSFLRIFDIPLASAAVVFLAVYFFAGGSILGGLIALVGIGVAEIFSLALTIWLARFFYARVAGGGGRSKWQTFLRFVFMLVWILPTFAAYFVISFADNIVLFFASLTQNLSSFFQLLVLVFPFSYGVLVSYATYMQTVDYTVLGLAIVSSAGYVAAAYYCLKWVTSSVRSVSAGTIVRILREVVKDTIIAPHKPWLEIIRKDLRIASRSPSYASLFLLPAIQTAVLAISFSSIEPVGNELVSMLGILVGVSLITLLLPPTLISIEGLASSYTRSLPLKKRTLISAKALLSVATYAISLIVLFAVALYLGRNFGSILIYGGINAFSISAATMLELAILANKFWKEGFSIGNIYARLSTYILILIPAYVLVGVPIIASFATYFFNRSLTLPVFFISAFAEFALMLVVVLRSK